MQKIGPGSSKSDNLQAKKLDFHINLILVSYYLIF